MKRMTIEFQEYRRTGNGEHLFNIANYCILESVAPQNKKYHLNTLVDSVTRGKMGGNRV